MRSEATYEELAERFVADQRTVLGDRATQLADAVEGLQVSEDGSVDIRGDGRNAIARLAEEFRGVFGENVEHSMLAAARQLDHAVEIPPSLAVDRTLQGHTEYREDEDWQTATELEDVDPQPEVWARLFGFGTADVPASEFDAAPIAEARGIPMDASDPVYEAWLDQKEAEDGIKVATGHTWVTAAEIPDSLLSKAADELVGTLQAAVGEFGPDDARLVVWLRYEPRA